MPPQKAKNARQELDQTEVAYYEANLCYQIMIINLAYVSIEFYKSEKRKAYNELLR